MGGIDYITSNTIYYINVTEKAVFNRGMSEAHPPHRILQPSQEASGGPRLVYVHQVAFHRDCTLFTLK